MTQAHAARPASPSLDPVSEELEAEVAAILASPDTRVVTVEQLEAWLGTLEYADVFIRSEMFGLHNPLRTQRISEIRAIIGEKST